MSFMLLGILNSQAAGAGGAGAYDLLETTTLTSTAASITFSSLGTYAANYKHLQIRAVTRDTRAISGSNNVIMRFNGDTTSAYKQMHILTGDGSTISSYDEAQTSYILPFAEPSANDTTNAFGAAVVDLLDAFSSSKYTTSRSLRGYALAAANQVALSSGLWMNTNALTEIYLAPIVGSFAANTRVSLYGVKG
jgi:hypothetical protein